VDDIEISRLIRTLKRITERPTKAWKDETYQRRKDFRLESADGGGEKFRAFARQSTVYPENFSIGLEYDPPDAEDSVILIRCNGPHRDFNGQSNPEHPHFHPHVHKASSLAISKGERAEKYAERTDKFAGCPISRFWDVGIAQSATAPAQPQATPATLTHPKSRGPKAQHIPA
jgi:hypothetical protein